MKSFLNKVAVVITLAVASVAVQAQSASTVEFGRTTLTFDPSFTATMASLGATIGGVGFASVDSTGTIVFPVVSGVVDLQTAGAEINHLGGISVNANGIQLRLQNFAIDSTTTAPVLTAMLVVNNKLMKRFPLFDLAPPAIALPLPTTAGVLQVNGFTVTVNGTGAATINAIFGNNAIPAGLLVGTLNLYAVLSPNSSI